MGAGAPRHAEHAFPGQSETDPAAANGRTHPAGSHPAAGDAYPHTHGNPHANADSFAYPRPYPHPNPHADTDGYAAPAVPHAGAALSAGAASAGF